MGLPVSSGHEEGERFAEHFLVRVRKHALGRPVPRNDVTALIADNDGVGRGFDQATEPLLALAQCAIHSRGLGREGGHL